MPEMAQLSRYLTLTSATVVLGASLSESPSFLATARTNPPPPGLWRGTRLPNPQVLQCNQATIRRGLQDAIILASHAPSFGSDSAMYRKYPGKAAPTTCPGTSHGTFARAGKYTVSGSPRETIFRLDLLHRLYRITIPAIGEDHVWQFADSYADVRELLVNNATIATRDGNGLQYFAAEV
ncbi:hypothetical protein FQN55_000497 [Onygenales sp. PD_40]|nr:hypothetical protein FQN55_000497 [Onygenales sp. PD_40]